MNIREDIRRFVLDNFVFGENGEKLQDDTSFLENGIIDSTGILELVEYLEQHYGIKMQDEELVPDNLDSIQNITRYLETKRPKVNKRLSNCSDL